MNKLMITGILLLSLSYVSVANAKTCELVINSNDQMKFDQTELKIDGDCHAVKLTLNHTGQLAKNVMGHNWVLSETSNMQSIATAAMAAGLENEYLPADRSQIIAASSLIGGGESTTVTFDATGLSKDTAYTFFCSFPGHWALMKGQFIVE